MATIEVYPICFFPIPKRKSLRKKWEIRTNNSIRFLVFRYIISRMKKKLICAFYCSFSHEVIVIGDSSGNSAPMTTWTHNDYSGDLWLLIGQRDQFSWIQKAWKNYKERWINSLLKIQLVATTTTLFTFFLAISTLFVAIGDTFAVLFAVWMKSAKTGVAQFGHIAVNTFELLFTFRAVDGRTGGINGIHVDGHSQNQNSKSLWEKRVKK